MLRGGAKRMMLPCVGFANRPSSASLMQTFQAMSGSVLLSITKAFKRPLPRTTLTISRPKPLISRLNLSPISAALSAIFSSTNTFKDSNATAEASGLPPYVEPCYNSIDIYTIGMTLAYINSAMYSYNKNRTCPG